MADNDILESFGRRKRAPYENIPIQVKDYILPPHGVAEQPNNARIVGVRFDTGERVEIALDAAREHKDRPTIGRLHNDPSDTSITTPINGFIVADGAMVNDQLAPLGDAHATVYTARWPNRIAEPGQGWTVSTKGRVLPARLKDLDDPTSGYFQNVEIAAVDRTIACSSIDMIDTIVLEFLDPEANRQHRQWYKRPGNLTAIVTLIQPDGQRSAEVVLRTNWYLPPGEIHKTQKPQEMTRQDLADNDFWQKHRGVAERALRAGYRVEVTPGSRVQVGERTVQRDIGKRGNPRINGMSDGDTPHYCDLVIGVRRSPKSGVPYTIYTQPATLQQTTGATLAPFTQARPVTLSPAPAERDAPAPPESPPASEPAADASNARNAPEPPNANGANPQTPEPAQAQRSASAPKPSSGDLTLENVDLMKNERGEWELWVQSPETYGFMIKQCRGAGIALRPWNIANGPGRVRAEQVGAIASIIDQADHLQLMAHDPLPVINDNEPIAPPSGAEHQTAMIGGDAHARTPTQPVAVIDHLQSVLDSAYESAKQADATYQALLVKHHGDDAGDARYERNKQEPELIAASDEFKARSEVLHWATLALRTARDHADQLSDTGEPVRMHAAHFDPDHPNQPLTLSAATGEQERLLPRFVEQWGGQWDEHTRSVSVNAPQAERALKDLAAMGIAVTANYVAPAHRPTMQSVPTLTDHRDTEQTPSEPAPGATAPSSTPDNAAMAAREPANARSLDRVKVSQDVDQSTQVLRVMANTAQAQQFLNAQAKTLQGHFEDPLGALTIDPSKLPALMLSAQKAHIGVTVTPSAELQQAADGLEETPLSEPALGQSQHDRTSAPETGLAELDLSDIDLDSELGSAYSHKHT